MVRDEPTTVELGKEDRKLTSLNSGSMSEVALSSSRVNILMLE